MQLKSMFLGTTRFFPKPDDEGGSAAADGNTGGEHTNGEQDADGVQAEDGQEGDVQGGDEVNADDEGESEEGDEEEVDPDEVIASLDPKVQAAINKKMAKETGWRDKQLNRSHRNLNNSRAEAEALRAIAEGRATPSSGVKKDADGNIVMTPEQLQAEVQRQAAIEAGKSTFDAECNAANSEGKRRYGAKWDTALARLPQLGGLDQETLVGVLATDDPAQVLYKLASDPDEYERVTSLPPHKRQTEIVKLALPKPGSKTVNGKTVKEPSKAPAPTTPVTGSRGRTAPGRVDLYDDKTSDEAWYARRNAERAKKFSTAS